MAAVSTALAATVRAGDRVVLHSPAWPNVGNAARLRGAQVDELPLTALAEGGFRMDFDRLDAMLDGARAFILNSPNNPTGWTATLDELATILEIARRRRVWLISDEVYSRLIYDGATAAPSLLDLAEPDDRVIVCNSFSKTWVMTGWRLGWLVVPEGARDAVTELVEVMHSGVAPFIQHAGLAAVQDTAVVERFRAHCATGRALMGDALNGLNGVRYVQPDGAFYAFVGVEGLTDSLTTAIRLVTENKASRLRRASRSVMPVRVTCASASRSRPIGSNARCSGCAKGCGCKRRNRCRSSLEHHRSAFISPVIPANAGTQAGTATATTPGSPLSRG